MSVDVNKSTHLYDDFFRLLFLDNHRGVVIWVENHPRNLISFVFFSLCPWFTWRDLLVWFNSFPSLISSTLCLNGTWRVFILRFTGFTWFFYRLLYGEREGIGWVKMWILWVRKIINIFLVWGWGGGFFVSSLQESRLFWMNHLLSIYHVLLESILH